MTRVPVADRFWSKVDRLGEDDCWPWTKATMSNGYGVFQLGRGLGTVLAHRLAHEVNLERGNGVGAQNSRKDTCPQGHPYDWIYIRADQWSDRRCSRCYGPPYGNYVLI